MNPPLMMIAGALVVMAATLAAMGYRGREQIVGIDLGTTFSVVAVKSHQPGPDFGKITVVPDRHTAKLLVPSVVSFMPHRTVVGRAAVELRDTHPRHVVFNTKRFIGRSMSDVEADKETQAYKVGGNTSAPSGAPPQEVASGFMIPKSLKDGELAERWVSPIDAGAAVVKHLMSSVAVFMGYEIKRAVICVPAKFGPEEAKATKFAFEQAGIKVMRVLDEPTAAAVAYNLHKDTSARTVLVYDIGGGTLDTSLLYMNGHAVSMLGVAGDDRLGGSDFDKKVLQLLQGKLVAAPESEHVRKEDRTEAEPVVHHCDYNGLHQLAEEVKIRLSAEEKVEVQCLDTSSASGPKLRSLAVTVEEFEEASQDLFDRAIHPVEKVLEDQHMQPENVDDVVLVGGASRTPKLRRLLREFFGTEKALHTDIDPDITVAYGAANILD